MKLLAGLSEICKYPNVEFHFGFCRKQEYHWRHNTQPLFEASSRFDTVEPFWVFFFFCSCDIIPVAESLRPHTVHLFSVSVGQVKRTNSPPHRSRHVAAHLYPPPTGLESSFVFLKTHCPATILFSFCSVSRKQLFLASAARNC